MRQGKFGARMNNYRQGSEWNDEMELRCLLVFKRLEEEKFPRSRQLELCRELSRSSGLDVGNLSAKVSNYKSVAGVNMPSNASENTIAMYKRYGSISSTEITRVIDDGKF
jgi:hypothetical protein